MIDRCLNCLATLGRCSVISMPLAAVGFGRCGPPLLLPGFMSQRSMVGGTAGHPEDDQAFLLLLHLRRGRPHLGQELHTGQSDRGSTRGVFQEMPTIGDPEHVECSDWAGHL